jgi:FdhD protein
MLFTEGVIRRGADVLGVRPVAEDAVPAPDRGTLGGSVVEVEFAWPPEGRAAQRFLYSSAACGACGKTSLDALEVRAPAVAAPLRIGRGVLHSLPARMRAAQPAFGETGGLHATALFAPDGALTVLREDVGRHNAFDKAVGWALARDLVPLADRVALLSGRASYELVQKAIVAGVPVVAAVGAPSSLAVALAERFGVTLVGFLRPDTANVYSHAERVAGA